MKIFRVRFRCEGHRMDGVWHGCTPYTKNDHINATSVLNAMSIMERRYNVIEFLLVEKVCFVLTEDKYPY